MMNRVAVFVLRKENRVIIVPDALVYQNVRVALKIQMIFFWIKNQASVFIFKSRSFFSFKN